MPSESYYPEIVCDDEIILRNEATYVRRGVPTGTGSRGYLATAGGISSGVRTV